MMKDHRIESIEMAWEMAITEDPYRIMARWILDHEPADRHFIAELAIAVGEAEANKVAREWLDRQNKILRYHEAKHKPNEGYEYPGFIRVEKIDFNAFAAKIYPDKPEKIRNIKAGRAWNGLERLYSGYFLMNPNDMKGNQRPPQLPRLPLTFLFPPKNPTDEAWGLDFASLVKFIDVYDEVREANPELTPNEILGFDFANDRIEFLRGFVDYKKQQLQAEANRYPAG